MMLSASHSPNVLRMKDSIATQLLKTVFYFYIILTVVMTVTHISAEFFSIKKKVEHELKISSDIFTPGISKALWDINSEQLSLILMGMTEFAYIVGAKVEDQQGESIESIGIVINNEGKALEVKPDGTEVLIKGYTGLFSYSFPINYEQSGEKIKVGEAIFYSSTKIIFNELKLGTMLIITNSIITMLVFCFLILWIAKRKLSKPLGELTTAVEEINLNELDNLKITVNTEGNNELKILEKAFNSMIQNLLKARLQLQELIKAYSRFFPHEFLTHLNKKSITDLKLGDGIKENMCILFSDLRAFTTISEQMTPEESFRFLNSYFSQIAPIIKRHSGFIDKFIGDAIMAIFSSEPDKAVQAGIDMFHQLKKYNQIQEHENNPYVNMGIGIHSGPIMLGTIGEETRMETTVISDTVNLASRLESMTKIYGISLIISEAVYNELKQPEKFAIRMIDSVKAKGKKKAVMIFEVYNADFPEIFDKKTSTLKDFQKGMELYYLKKLTEAKKLFEKCLSVFPEDKVSEIYIKRCDHYLKVGLSDDWDGVTKLDIK
jgi:class 3 adenylate cyclase/HAMP domain-containing protein